MGRYNKPEQYENIVSQGEPRWRDPPAQGRRPGRARALRTTTCTRTSTAIPRRPSSSSRLPGSNAATVIEEVKDKLEEMKTERSRRAWTSRSATTSPASWKPPSSKVLHTLFEAFVLVALVVFLFLGDWRSTLIPTLAVPVSLDRDVLLHADVRHCRST